MGNRWFVFLVMMMLAFSPVSAEPKGDAGVTPDSAMWGVDKAFDSVSIAFTFGSEEKAKKRLEVARERLAELSQMVEEDQLDAAEEARAEHEELLGEVAGTELSSEDALQELDAVVGIEEEILSQQAAVSELKVRIQGRLSADQQAKLDAFLATLDGSVEGVEIRIRERKDRTLVKVRSSVDNPEEAIEAKEQQLVPRRAEQRIAQAEHEILKAEVRIARFEARVQEISGSDGTASGPAPEPTIAGSADEQEPEASEDDSPGSEADSTESVQDEAINAMTGNFAVVTGRASGSGRDGRDESRDDSDESDESDDRDESDDQDDRDESDDQDDRDESDDQDDEGSRSDDSDEPESELDDGSAEGSDDEADGSTEGSDDVAELEEEFETDEPGEDPEDGNIIEQFGLVVPEYEERGVEVAKLYVSEAKAALDTARSALASEPRKAYAYATFAKKLAQRAQSGKYLKLTEEQKDAIEAREEAEKLAEREADDAERAQRDADRLAERTREERVRLEERASEDRQRLDERAREDAQRREERIREDARAE